ncbi:MAG: polyprenyl synthetase family protein [Sedimentisphaerales bacterium]|nr:polyprenyl synthetase family protein [Sedimentisphaerales bacterium]
MSPFASKDTRDGTRGLHNMQLPPHTEISASRGVAAFKIIRDELERVRKLINEQLLCCPDKADVRRLVEHLHRCGGKMIRPGLVLLAGGTVGKITDKHIRIAAIMEMIHNATLLHDDVIDDGQRRRGQATVNSLWGNESAVLLGDFLLSNVFKMCADLEPHIVKVIAAAAGRTCEGELRQIAQRGNWQLNEAEYIDIITEKSAALFSSCCYLGGFLAGAGEKEVGLLSDFGLNLGVAFQIADDLLDLAGDQYKTGKPVGSDLDNGKVTLPVIHLLKTANEADKKLVVKEKHAGLVEKLRACGSIDYAQKRAQEFAERAIAAIKGFSQSESKEALIELARFAVQRAV